MKQFLILVLIFLLGKQVYSQNIDKEKLVRIWGQVTEFMPRHHGKGGGILLTIKEDKSFHAFENTDYGATILQSGTWEIKKNKITFNVTNTTLGRKEKEYFMKGKILELDKGKIVYQIIKLDNEEFIIKAIKSNKLLKFKISEYNYGPK